MVTAACGRVRQRDAIHDRHADIGEQQFEGAFFAREHVKRLRAVMAVMTSWPSCRSARAIKLRIASSSSAIRMRATVPFLCEYGPGPPVRSDRGNEAPA